MDLSYLQLSNIDKSHITNQHVPAFMQLVDNDPRITVHSQINDNLFNITIVFSDNTTVSGQYTLNKCAGLLHCEPSQCLINKKTNAQQVIDAKAIYDDNRVSYIRHIINCLSEYKTSAYRLFYMLNCINAGRRMSVKQNNLDCLEKCFGIGGSAIDYSSLRHYNVTIDDLT